jgi:hypothetical protein
MTISYRSVAFGVVAIILLIGIVAYFMFPESSPARYLSEMTDKVINRLDSSTKVKLPTTGAQQAHFTAVEGTVKVKKASSNVWINADYTIPLERGDVVQTSSEGIAKLVFMDGTNYTVKQDSLIVIEENSTNDAQQTNVSVQVTTGTVDLATSTYTQGSKSQVIVAGASASLAPESAAMVRNDPRSDQHEILVKKGSGEVVRGSERVVLADYERVSFKDESAKMAKTKEIGPPTLIQPSNMAPVYATNGQVSFSWTPISASHGYRLRVSKNPYFSSTVYDKVLAGTDVKLTGLPDGNYYWNVTTVDIDGKQSVESERNQFTVLSKGPDSTSLALELSPFIQHGHVIEVKGRTEPGARVMVNGQQVPLVGGDGTFQFFTPPLPNGANMITITAQNSKGGVRTEQKRIVIE